MREEVTVEETEASEDEVDEERIREMLDLEERLVSERRDTDTDTEDCAEEIDDETEKEEESATGTIRVVTEDGDQLRVEFFVDGETHEDTIPMPDDPSDPDEAVNRLCRVCGVALGRVADLQGESVPVVEGRHGRGYDLALPSTAARPALAVFRLWWWLRRRGISPKSAKRVAAVPPTFALYYAGMRTLALFHTHPDGVEAEVAAGAVFPFVGTEFFTTGIANLVVPVIGLALVGLAVVSGMVTTIAVVVAGILFLEKATEWMQENLNPF